MLDLLVIPWSVVGWGRGRGGGESGEERDRARGESARAIGKAKGVGRRSEGEVRSREARVRAK